MSQNVTIAEALLISITCVLVYAFVKTILESFDKK